MIFLAGCTNSQTSGYSTYEDTQYTSSRYSQSQLDSLLAPIALYPDTVLTHVLIASTYPLEVIDAARWAKENDHLKGDAALYAADNKPWDPSVRALVAFPDVLDRMASDLDWTQQVGDMFLSDEAAVMATVQALRQRAYDAGTLSDIDHVRVIRDEREIVIEPSVERVVYVPYYDTRHVYGSWWWATMPPVYWHHPASYSRVGSFYWGPRVTLGPRFYFVGSNWQARSVYVVNREHHHRFYDSRSVIRHQSASRWLHDAKRGRPMPYRASPPPSRVFTNRPRFNEPREVYRPDQRPQYRRDVERRTTERQGFPVPPQQRQERRDDHRSNENRRQPDAMVGRPDRTSVSPNNPPRRTDRPAVRENNYDRQPTQRPNDRPRPSVVEPNRQPDHRAPRPSQQFNQRNTQEPRRQEPQRERPRVTPEQPRREMQRSGESRAYRLDGKPVPDDRRR